MTRLIVRMNHDEWVALIEWAQKEYRDPRAQAALIIREVLLQKGLLNNETIHKEKINGTQTKE